MSKQPEENGFELCREHSGMSTKLNGVLALLTTIAGLLGYQIFMQVPDMRLELTKNLMTLEARVKALEDSYKGMKIGAK
jgi:hypothetical protein